MARRKKSLKLLFVADPPATFNPVRETTLLLMREASRRGHEIYATTPAELGAHGKEVFVRCRKLKVLDPRQRPWFKVLLAQNREVKGFDAVLLRKDPPFDMAYLNHLYLLDLVSSEVYMMNHPRGILMANEKLFPLRSPGIVPETMISASEVELRRFIQSRPKGVVIKPIGSSGGRGVFWIQSPKSPNQRVILEAATAGFSQHVVAQEYLPVVKRGDKRIILLGQKFLGVFLRRPAPGDHRANLHSGGSLHPAALTRQDQKIIAVLQPLLEEYGLDFVGLDVIEDRLTEVNVTSPMGLKEINDTGCPNSERQVLDFIERRIQ